MVLRACSVAQIILVGLATGAAMLPDNAAADNFFHPGRVIERGTDAPVSADVKAWAAARRTGESGDCPEFGDAPVDARTSDPASGDFSVTVPSEVRTYTVVYCANGYHRKVDRHLPNDKGSPVFPFPARLRKQSESPELDADTVRLALFALNELAYLYEVNPESFMNSLNEYRSLVSERDGTAGEVLGALPILIAQWASP